jgi:hypothetical protein
MMKTAWLTFLLLISVSAAGFSQSLINDYRNIARRQVRNYARQAHYKTILNEGDTSLSLLVRDSTVGRADFIYDFSKPGRYGTCDRETVILCCDSCLRKFLNPVLATNRYRWVRINDSLYVSSFAKKRLLAVAVKDPFYSYIITRTHWNREEYGKMVGRSLR